MKDIPRLIVIAGPTASGKSDFAVELALTCNGEIISADSRQLYKGLDIGTGKISVTEMKGIPHHMMDIILPTDTYSVLEYQLRALPIITDILARGKTPIICGGTGQYIDALMYDTRFPQVSPDTKLRALLAKLSTDELYHKLQSLDKRRAEDIDKHNRVRIIRALEIIASLGTVPVAKKESFRYATTMYLLSPTKKVLLERISVRLEKRLIDGMLEEGRKLLTYTFSDAKIASLGLEYIWMNKYLTNSCSYDEMKKQIITKSWQYAKRQMTWNKKYDDFVKKVEVE